MKKARMRYFIKPIGRKGKSKPFFGPWYFSMVTQKMPSKETSPQRKLIDSVKPGGKFVIYCIIGRFSDLKKGGFVGIQTVKSKAYIDRNIYGEPWTLINNVSLDLTVNLQNPDNLLPISVVREWPNNSNKLKKALSRNLQGGLFEITKTDFYSLKRHLILRRG